MVELLENKEVKYKPIQWCEDNLVMYNDGQAWTSVIIDGQSEHCHLGKEADVRAILSGSMPITDTYSYKRQMALVRVLEIKEEINAKRVREDGMERGGNNGAAGSKQANTRLPQNRKRATRRGANQKRARVFRR